MSALSGEVVTNDVSAEKSNLVENQGGEQQQQQEQPNNEAKLNYENEAQKLEDKALVFLTKQARPVVIPDFAKWFDINKIHDIEKKSLPEFFNESSRFKTEKAYKDTRNFIINTYRLSPFEYLTMTSIRRNIAMDVSSIYKIFDFVEKWGLINYRIDPRSKSSLIGPSFTGHFKILLDTPDGLKPFVPSLVENEDLKRKRCRSLYDDDVDTVMNDLSIRKNIYDELQDFNALKSIEKSSTQIHRTFICHICSNDSIDVFYQNLRLRDANLCVNCYDNNHFTDMFNKDDYIKLNLKEAINHNWSDQEVVLLLEGLEMFQNDWEKIIAHIGNRKTIEQCVEKYLSLPIDPNDITEFIRRFKAKKIVENDSLYNEIDHEKDERMALIRKTINSLKYSLDNIVSEKNSEKEMKTKELIEESQPVIEELSRLKLSSLDVQFNKLYELEKKLKVARDSCNKEKENLSNDRIMLSKQILDLNKELKNSKIEKKIVLNSSDGTQIKLIDIDNESNKNMSMLKKFVDTDVEAISQTNMENYTVVSL